jgi:hypothetical protein
MHAQKCHRFVRHLSSGIRRDRQRRVRRFADAHRVDLDLARRDFVVAPEDHCDRLHLEVGGTVRASGRVLEVVLVEVLVVPLRDLALARLRQLLTRDARPERVLIIVDACIGGTRSILALALEAGAAEAPGVIERGDLNRLRAPGAAARWLHQEEAGGEQKSTGRKSAHGKRSAREQRHIVYFTRGSKVR